MSESPFEKTDGPVNVVVKVDGKELEIEGKEAGIHEIRVCEGISTPPELKVECSLSSLDLMETALDDHIQALLDKKVTVDFGFGENPVSNIFTGQVTRVGNLISGSAITEQLQTAHSELGQLQSFGAFEETERDFKSTPEFFWKGINDQGTYSVVIGGGHETLERMQKNRRCKIYLKQKYKDIISSVISDNGGKLTCANGPAAVINYLVQYQESDYNFMLRLGKEAGLVYSSLVDGEIEFRDFKEDASQSARYKITNRQDNLCSATVKARDLDLKSTVIGNDPLKLEVVSEQSTKLQKKIESKGALAGELIEMVPEVGDRYPADILPDLANHASGFQDAYAALGLIKFVCANVLRPGEKVELDSMEFLVQSVEHELKLGQYRCIVTAVASGLPYYSVQQPHIPRIYGPQTAIVVSNKPDEADGCLRVKVKFHWPDGDQENANSAWVRVVQPWAGVEHGTQFIPQPEDEVVVEFMNGDPSCPLITGSVYNGKNKEFYPVADKEPETVTCIKTRTNELKIDDAGGEEMFQITAKKSFHTFANDEKANIKVDDTAINIQHTEKPITVKADKETITLEAAKSITLKVGSNQIVIDTSGITVKGTKVEVSSDAGTDVKSSAITTVEGSLVQIN